MPTKYRAVRTEVDGLLFDSRAEARRYQELKLLEKAREISSLICQPVFRLEVNGQLICTYRADFIYTDHKTGKTVVEDVKGVRTPVYRMKAKLMRALHNIEIVEVQA